MAGDVPFPGVEKFPSADVLTCTLLYGTEKQKTNKNNPLVVEASEGIYYE